MFLVYKQMNMMKVFISFNNINNLLMKPSAAALLPHHVLQTSAASGQEAPERSPASGAAGGLRSLYPVPEDGPQPRYQNQTCRTTEPTVEPLTEPLLTLFFGLLQISGTR